VNQRRNAAASSEPRFINRSRGIERQGYEMTELISDLRELPRGSHALGFYSSEREAADRALRFLQGAPPGQRTAYWVEDEALKAEFDRRLSEAAPLQVGCVGILPEGQIESTPSGLRPVAEIREFVAAHPEGVTAAADTLHLHWDPQDPRPVLEYEEWFDGLARDESRFLCPYDLRELAAPDARGAARAVRELASHHSHVALSETEDPALRLLQLFVFASEEEVPEVLMPAFRQASDEGLIETGGSGGAFLLTAAGERLVADWSHSMTAGS
jgi:hypothetical protein